MNGTYTIAKTFRFEAAHFLPHVPEGHQCGRMHGHSWVVEVGLNSNVLKGAWVLDFGEVSKNFKPVIDALDHRVLNDFPGLQIPTSEVLAHVLATEFSAILEQMGHSHVTLAFVRVHETCTSECTFTPEHQHGRTAD